MTNFKEFFKKAQKTYAGRKPPTANATARGFSTAKKRKPTKKQLAALAKGRKALARKYK